MSTPRIHKKTITADIYIGSSGKETPVTEMADVHLLNALLVANEQDNDEVRDVLFDEALRRMKKRIMI